MAEPSIPCTYCEDGQAACVGEGGVPTCAACCSHAGGPAPGPCIPIASLSPAGRSALSRWWTNDSDETGLPQGWGELVDSTAGAAESAADDAEPGDVAESAGSSTESDPPPSSAASDPPPLAKEQAQAKPKQLFTKEVVLARLKPLAVPAFQHAVALIASVVVALSYGFNYGVSNQNAYMLQSKRVLDGALYKNDWLVSQTTHYHLSFRYISAPLIALDRRGWAVAYAQIAAISVGMMFVHHLLRRLVKPAPALAGYLALVGIVFVTRTTSINVTYVFDEIFQPSTLGSVGLLAAAAFLARGRWLGAGIAMAFSGLFHANYLLLELAAFGLAHLLLGRKDFWPRSLKLFGPPTVVLVLFLPMLMASVGGDPKEAELAQTFYMRIRSPHHFNLKPSEPGLMASLAWVALGLGFGGRVLASRIEARRLSALILGLLTIIGFGMVFSSLWETRSVNMLFAWRLMPHVELLLVALYVAGLAESLSNPYRLFRAGPAAIASLAAGFATLAVFGAYHSRAAIPKTVMGVGFASLFGMGVVALLSAATRWIGTKPFRIARRVAPWVLAACASVLVYKHAEAKNPEAKKKSNLYSGGDKSMKELCGWVIKKTSKDAVFLTPPDLESFRFQCERAIIVDWKTPPIVPKDLLAWITRLEDVTGRKKITSRKDLSGYSSLDDARLDKLRAKYQIDYVVIRSGRKPYGLKPVFTTRGFSVFDMRQAQATEAAAEVETPPTIENVEPSQDVDPDGVLDQ